jgi:cellulose biosynthesis protein BcsQ
MMTIAIANRKGGGGKTTSIRIIFEYRPDSHGAEDYLALCREIVRRKNQ